MKIQIFGDSFGLPRFYKHDGFDYENFGKPEAGKVIQLHYEDTYPEKVRRGLQVRLPGEDIVLINNCAQVYNSYNLMGDFKTAYLHQPDYIVVQVGIVDSSPRAAGAEAPFPFMQGKSPWVSIAEFQNNLLSFIELCLIKIASLKSMILINIVKASEDHYQRHPGARENTVAYNHVISDLCRIRAEKGPDGKKEYINLYLADMFSIVGKMAETALCTDGVHINAAGSHCLAGEIVELIAAHCKIKR
jgi:Lysophospholipase L1 and related esterases